MPETSHPILSTIKPVVDASKHVHIHEITIEAVSEWMAYEALPWPDSTAVGTIEKARIVLTAVESAPVGADKAETLLIGKKLTEDVIEEAASVAYRPAKPLDNTDLTHAYRKKMARVYVARALRELMRAEP